MILSDLKKVIYFWKDKSICELNYENQFTSNHFRWHKAVSLLANCQPENLT